MTKLIPLDAAIACLTETFKGIGEREIDTLDGWRETSSECDFGADRLNTAIVGLQAIPTIDPAAIREAALREAAYVAINACLVPPDGGSPTEAESLVCEEAYRRILALIGKANSMIGENK